MLSLYIGGGGKALSFQNAPRIWQAVWKRGISALFFSVRPAWAHSCGCKSRRKLITANEAKRNCARVTERGEEAWTVNRESMNKNHIEGAAEQGERQKAAKL